MEKASAAKIVSLADFIQIRSPAILSSRKALALHVLMHFERDG
jgi:hypothetical protein